MKEREQVRVWISAKAKGEIQAIAKTIGISQIELLSRICERFAIAGKGEKLRILGILGGDEDVQQTQNTKKSG